jgi:hypothetical protein
LDFLSLLGLTMWHDASGDPEMAQIKPALPALARIIVLVTALVLMAPETLAQATGPDGGSRTVGGDGGQVMLGGRVAELPAPMAEALNDLRRAGGGALVAEVTPRIRLIVTLRQAAQALREGRQAEVQQLLREAALSARRQGQPFEMPRTLSELENLAQIRTMDLQNMLQGKQQKLQGQQASIDLQNMLQSQQQLIQMLSNISALLADTSMGVIRNMNGGDD